MQYVQEGRRWGGIVLLLGTLVASASSRGEELVTWELRGSVDAVNDDYDLLNGSIQGRDAFLLRISFDPETKGQPSSKSASTYVSNSRAQMKLVIADREFATNQQLPLEIIIRNNDPVDSLVAAGTLTVPADLQTVKWSKHTLTLSMRDDSGDVLSDARLPALVDRKDWDRVSCRVSFVRSARFTGLKFYPAASIIVRGTIESVRLAEAAGKEDP